MATRAAIGVFGILVIFLALFAVYGCGGGGADPTSTAELGGTLSGDPNAASGALGDGGLADDGNTGDAPTDVAPGLTDVAPTDAAPDGDGNHPNRRWMRGHPVVGTITAIEDRVMVLEPEVPEFISQRIREHLADSDRPADFPWPPELPDEVRLRLTADTVFKVGGEKVDGLPFGVGDKVVAWPGRSSEFDMRIARVVADYATFAERWQAWHDGEGDRPQTDGPPHFRGAMPAWGEITGLTDNSITIKPVIPEGMLERIREHWDGDGLPFDLPESMTFTIDADTKYFRDGEAVRPGAFAVGDSVFIMPRRQGDDATAADAPVAAFVSDGTSFRRHHERDGDSSGLTISGPRYDRNCGGPPGEDV